MSGGSFGATASATGASSANDEDLVLYYTPGTCAAACMVALEWAKTPYWACRVEKEERASVAYAKVNRRGAVPAMRAHGRVIVEANAILAHVARAAIETSEPLLPDAGEASRDLANQWLAYLASGFHAAFWPYFRPDRYTSEPAHEASVKTAAAGAIRRELAFVDAELEGRAFVAFDHRTVLDAYLHAMDRWANAIVDMASEFPNVWSHQRRFAADPAVRLVKAIERSGQAALGSDAPHACRGHVPLDR